MQRRNRLSRSRDFDAVYRHGRSVSTRFLTDHEADLKQPMPEEISAIASALGAQRNGQRSTVNSQPYRPSERNSSRKVGPVDG